MPKDAVFRLQSMTKPVVTVAALALYDEGKFALDEPISKQLPEWAEPKLLENGRLVPARSATEHRRIGHFVSWPRKPRKSVPVAAVCPTEAL